MKLKKSRIFDNVYRQLEVQDAVSLFETYKEILSPSIEMSVREKYNVAADRPNTYANDTYTYYAPDGGVATYVSQLGAEVAVTCLDYNNSYYYVLGGGSFQVETIIETILGFLPDWGNVFGGIFAFNSVADYFARQDIIEAGGYAKIMNVYDPVSMDQGSVVMGWDTYPRLYIYDSDGAPEFTYFPEYNPFE